MLRISLIVGLFLFACVPLRAQTYAPLSGFCEKGASQAITSGLQSSNYLQGVVPVCTVTVYQTGTLNLATIYSNSSGTPLTNPFTANTSGQWIFYASVAGYDVVMSGGIPPNVYITPVTLVNVSAGIGSVSGCAVAGNPYSLLFTNPLATGCTSDSSITANPNTHTVTSPNIFSTSNPVISADSQCSTADGYGGTDYLYCMQQACNAIPNGVQGTIELSNGPHSGYSQFACAKSVVIKGNGAIIELEPKGSGPGVFTSTANAPFITLDGCTLTPGSVLVTGCSNTNLLQIYDRVGGVGVPVGAYVNCLGVWNAGTCTVTSGEFSLSLPSQLYITGLITAGQTSMTGLGVLTDVTNGMTLGTYSGIPSSTTISALHYGGSSPYDVESLTLSNAATQTKLASIPVASTWTATLTSTPSPPIPAIQMSWNGTECIMGPEGPCTEAGIQDLTVIDPAVRSLSNASGIQVTGYDHFKYSQVQVLDIDGFGTEFGGPLTPYMVTNGPGKSTVRETDLYQTINYYDGDWATGQAGLEVMTGYKNCYPSANCSTVVDEVNEFRGYGVHAGANFGTNFLLGSYNPSVIGTSNGPRHVTMLGQFESLQESGSAGTPINLYQPPAADNIDIQTCYSSCNFIGSEINDAGWGHFLINSQYDGGISITGGTRVISQPDYNVYTVSSVGGTNTIQFVSAASGAMSFDTSGQWNGSFGVLVDNGSCAAPGCNVYFSPSNAVTNGGQTLNLAANLYGTTTDTTATLTMGQPAYYANFANSTVPANFVSAEMYDPDDTSYRGYTGEISATADHLWSGVYPSFMNFGQSVQNIQSQYSGNTGSSTVAPNLATNNTLGWYLCLDKPGNIGGDCAGWQYRNLTGAQSGTNRIEGVIGGNTWITYTNEGNLNFLPSDVGNLQIGGTTWLTAGRSANFSTLQITGIEGAGTYCLQISPTGVVSNTGFVCGSGASTPKVASLYVNSTLQATGTSNNAINFLMAITVSKAQFFVQEAASGCTTYPIVYLYDSTASTEIASATMTNGTTGYTMTLVNPAIPLGDTVDLYVDQAAATCSVYPSGPNIAFQYY